MPGGKLDSIREELDEAQNKVENCRDQLTTEMYSFVAKEADYSNLLLDVGYMQYILHLHSDCHTSSKCSFRLSAYDNFTRLIMLRTRFASTRNLIY